MWQRFCSGVKFPTFKFGDYRVFYYLILKFTIHDIFEKFKKEFAHSQKGGERGTWFVYTLIAIIIPFTSPKTSNAF